MEIVNIDYSKELILIVDDDPFLRETLEKLLEIVGIPSHSASNGDEAMKMLDNNKYTMILTDMKMPGVDGMDLIKMVCQVHEVSIIAMTGYSEGYTYVDVINAGASDFIKKPFGIEELEAKIRRVITERNLRKELNRLSITDSLTELYNQRHFYFRLNEEIKRAKRQKNLLALILLDLNDFKIYNDNYGHLAGDEVIRDAGDIIRRCIRESVDSGYRYGGDEFAVILIDADINIAKEIGSRIEAAFLNNNKVTVSVGYSIYNADMNVKELIDIADKDLYRSKQNKIRA
ncbi:MAG: diguanylate cyclase [Deltaproteobacteria bacterium]|nr:diguanylate cyclase [Deltaproteobacteria bacterium]